MLRIGQVAPPPSVAPGNPPLELILIVPDETRTFALPSSGEVTLGRAEDNGIRIDHPSVSRHHARLLLGATLIIEDLGSANGTLLQSDAPSSGASTQTLDLLPLKKSSAALKVGQTFMVGLATAIVRPAQVVSDFEHADSVLGSNRSVVVCDANMKSVYAQADRGAASSITVLILGETGVGKEVLARHIHARSPRASRPFMSINCAALSESLLEGELFGYEKGAFTGAIQARPGLFEAADGGSVFLDEIGEISLSTQAKLLRVLEERTVTRLGARSAKTIDVRFIAATNRDLRREVETERFRQDLYFRLDGLSLTIPPLRERPAEIEALVRYFLSASSRQMALREPNLSPAVLDILRRYTWPGNVRELRNVIDRAVVLCGGPTVEPDHLPPALLRATNNQAPPVSVAFTGGLVSKLSAGPPETASGKSSVRLKAELRAIEKLRVLQALESCGGNQTRAAEVLGISRRTLVSWLGEFGVVRPRKRADD